MFAAVRMEAVVDRQEFGQGHHLQRGPEYVPEPPGPLQRALVMGDEVAAAVPPISTWSWLQSSIDPELMVRMLIVGYCMSIRSERRLCEKVHLNLAYRWFCRLGLEGKVPGHSMFSRYHHGRFRQSEILRRLFEMVVERCLAEGLVGGEGFAVDASLTGASTFPSRHLVGRGFN